MSKILTLDLSVDLWLTYSWSGNNHGICGHTFEVIEYYYILKEYFNVRILLCEDITWDTLAQAIRNKYSFTADEIDDIKQNTLFNNRPTLLRGKNILFTDGGVLNTNNLVLLFDNVFHFACGTKEIKNNTKKNVYVLQDDRVYEPVAVNGINYKKKILFDKLMPVAQCSNNALVYATTNCRIFYEYEELKAYGKPVIAIVNKDNTPDPIDGFSFMNPPVPVLFDLFDTYIYTPVPRKWDCSPRFIAECKHYNKEVIYHNIDYWDVDHGLRWRKWDIDNDFSSLSLTPNDDVVSILKGII